MLATFGLAFFGSVWLLAGLLIRGGGLTGDWLQFIWQYGALPTAVFGLMLLTATGVQAAGWGAAEKAADRRAAWLLAAAVAVAYALLVLGQ